MSFMNWFGNSGWGAAIAILAFVVFTYMMLASFCRPSKTEKKLNPTRPLTDTEAEWIADYFHNADNAPDIDGYIGAYYLPIPATKIYVKKYGKERGWDDESIKEQLEELRTK